MQMEGLAPAVSDAEIPDDMDHWLDLNVYCIQIRKTPAKKVDSAREDLRGKLGSKLMPNTKS